MSNLRPIEVLAGERFQKAPGVAPEMAWLYLSDLVIDGDFQRPLERGNWTQIRKIAKGFDWAHFTPVVVAQIGDDRYSVIDGQHRCHAAMMVGVKSVPCIIHQLTTQQQARAFSAINGQVTAVSAFHLYRAALASCEPWAVTAQKVVADAGCELMVYYASASHKKPGQIYSIQLIRKTIEAGHAATITPILSALWQSPNSDRRHIWNNSVLEPCFLIIRENPRALRRDLGAFFKENCPERTLEAVAKMRATEAYRDTSARKLFNRVLQAQLTRWLDDTGGT